MDLVTKVVRKCELPQDQQVNRWSNEDIQPVAPERQTWGPVQFIELWFLVNMNMSSYQTGSALIASGMTYWQAIIVIVLGNAMAASFAVLNSVSGAKYHVGFPVVSRSVWGMWGSFFPVLNRILLSVVWFGVQSVIGGRMVYVLLRSVWIDLDARVPNTLPAHAGITTGEFAGFVVFNVLCCALIWLRPPRLRPYFHAASAVVCAALLALLAWALATSSGWGAVSRAPAGPASELGWTMCAGVMSVVGSISAGILNQNDFTRWAKRPSQVTWSQGVSFLLAGSTTATIGVLVTSATQERYGKGEALWDPSRLFRAIQDQHGARGRAAAFFLAAVMITSQLSINVVGNVLAGGLDVVAVAPRFINLRRGAYVILVLSVLPNPWQQLASGSTFLTVLSAYAVFVGPMIGLLCTHYYIIQQRTLHVPDLYRGSRASLYWYRHGVNWRTVAAWTLAVVPNMPGFVAQARGAPADAPVGARRVYDLCFVVGFVVAGAAAVVLHRVFPYAYHDGGGLPVVEAVADGGGGDGSVFGGGRVREDEKEEEEEEEGGRALRVRELGMR